jgi:hypothetical protein
VSLKLKGKLGEFPLPDVIQFLTFGRKTGRLVLLDDAHSSHGELYFNEGEVVDARAGDRSGEEAVFALLEVAGGEFEFRAAGEIPERTITVGINQLLLRAAQRMDEDQFDLAPEEGGEEAHIGQRKERMKSTILARLGKKGKMALAAVDTADATLDGLLAACERIEKYVSLFFDHELGEELGKELREIVGF